MATITVAQFIGRATSRYRQKYDRTVRRHRLDWMDFGNSLPDGDHVFFVGPYVISRPYGLNNDQVAKLLEWSTQHGLEFRINAPTSWHPSTIRISIFKEEWRKDFWDQAEQHGDAFYMGVVQGVYERSHGIIHRVYRGSLWQGDRRQETGVYILDTRGKHGIGDSSLPVTALLSAIEPFTIGGTE